MTKDEAYKMKCSSSPLDGCVHTRCMAWRWVPLNAATPEYIAALRECEKERGMKPKEAAAYVRDNMEEFGLPTKPFNGYCGLAGKP